MEKIITKPQAIFREDFRSRANVIRNGGTPNNVTFEDGKAVFDDTIGNNINYGCYKYLATKGKFSIRARFKFTTLNQGNVVRIDNFGIIRVIDGKIFTWGQGISSSFSTGGTYNDGQYKDVIVTVDVDYGVRIFVDGEFVKENLGTGDLTIIDGLLYVGSLSTGSEPFDGTIDFVEIYNRTLSAEEVSLLNSGSYSQGLSSSVKEQLGDELVVNGTFDTDSDWTVGSNWSIENGKAVASGVSGDAIKQSINTSLGIKYRITVDVTIESGSISGYLGSNGGIDRFMDISSSGSYQFEHNISVNNNQIFIYGFDGFVGSVDNISVKEVFNTDTTTLLDYQSINGVIEDKSGLNTLTPTDVSVKKNGALWSGEFNGSSSKIDCGSDFIGTKAITIMGWINPYSFGENNFGSIIHNCAYNGDSLKIRMYDDNKMQLTSDSVSYALSGNDSIEINKLKFISITRDESGVVNFYFGDKENAPELTGDANQDSGTPTAGEENVIIGNDTTIIRTFDGQIPILTVKEGILSLEQITQERSNTRWKV